MTLRQDMKLVQSDFTEPAPVPIDPLVRGCKMSRRMTNQIG